MINIFLQSINISESIYFCHWEMEDVIFRKCVLFMLLKAQAVFTIKIAKAIVIDLELSISVIY